MEYSLISIGRQFGSGGHKVGQLIADELRIPYYDKELLTLAAERGALPEQKLAKYDEKKHNNYFYELNYRGNENAHKGIPTAEALFELQSDIIRKLAESGKGVFVGRCADYVLEESDFPVLSVFIAAPLEARIKRVMERDGVTKWVAESLIKKKDKMRKHYYETHTGQKWGDPKSYDLYFDSSKASLTSIAQQIILELSAEQTT